MEIEGLENILISYHDPITGEKQEIPSLDERWVLDLDFFPYWNFPSGEQKDNQKLWFRSLCILRDDVIQLLKLPLHIFWSHVIFDPKFHTLCDTFLRITPVIISDNSHLLQNELFQTFLELMFKVFLRIGTNKEAQYTKNRTYPDISPKAFADLLYDNYLFDLPKILDLCLIFGSNRNLLGEMLEGIFRKQRKYFYDIQELIRSTLSMLSKVSEEMGCGLKLGDEVSSPVLLRDRSNKRLTLDRFYEIIIFVENIFTNLESFFVTCPSANQCFTAIFLNQFMNFYELFIPAVVNTWAQQRDNLLEKKELIVRSLRFTKLNFCKILSYVLENCYFTKFRATPLDQETVQAPLEDFLTICNILIGTKYLLHEYLKFFDFRTELHNMKMVGIIDTIQFRYLTEPLTDMEDDKSKPEVNPELEEAIVSIQAILPCVHSSSIKQVLLLHELNVGHALNTLLEKIPTVEITSEKVLVPRQPSPTLDLVSQRKNVFTGDKFDVFTNDEIDTNLIHKGKKEKYDTTFLNTRDQSDTKRTISNMELEYDDEYDDTYDDIPCDTGVDRVDGDTVQRLNPKGMFSHRYKKAELPQGSDEEAIDPVEPQKTVPQFINRKQDNRGLVAGVRPTLVVSQELAYILIDIAHVY